MTPATALAPATLPAAGGNGAYIRSATTDDAAEIHRLIAGHTTEGHLLPRERDEVALHAHRFVVACEEEGIVACVELAPLSRSVSEVRSLVVSERVRSLGVGRELIDELVTRARRAGFDRLCAFTHAPSYFVRLGFSMVPHVWLPEKIETDCHSCPHFRRCGQHAVLLELRPAKQFVAPTAQHG